MDSDDQHPISVTQARLLFAPWKTAPALVLAVSGGPDSVAMMWLAARWRGALREGPGPGAVHNDPGLSAAGPGLVAVTIAPGLRPEAAREARDVKHLAKPLDLPHRTLRWIGAKPKK